MMIPCRVEWYDHWPGLLITFPVHPGMSLLLDSDWEYIAFCFACGAPIGSGDPSSKEFNAKAWEQYDPTTIEQCPIEYLEQSSHYDGRTWARYTYDALKGTLGTLPKD